MQAQDFITDEPPRDARLLRDPVYTDEPKKPQQIAVSSTPGNTIIAVLCDDGSIWTLNTAQDVPQWYRLPSIR